MITRFLLSMLAVALTAATPACSADSPDSEDEVAEGALGAPETAGLGRGRYRVTARPDAVRAINEVFLLPTGSFWADFHAYISNVSGHRYFAAGTYRVESQGAKSKLVFSYSMDAELAPSDETYELVRHPNDALELRFVNDDGSTQEPFTLEPAGKANVATITFNGDWSVHKTGKLVPDGVLEIRYAMSRAQCERPWTTAFMSVDGGNAKPIQIPPQAGSVATVAVPIPAGNDLALWFQNQGASPRCEKWDSDFGRNYHFSIGR